MWIAISLSSKWWNSEDNSGVSVHLEEDDRLACPNFQGSSGNIRGSFVTMSKERPMMSSWYSVWMLLKKLIYIMGGDMGQKVAKVFKSDNCANAFNNRHLIISDPVSINVKFGQYLEIFHSAALTKLQLFLEAQFLTLRFGWFLDKRVFGEIYCWWVKTKKD